MCTPIFGSRNLNVATKHTFVGLLHPNCPSLPVELDRTVHNNCTPNPSLQICCPGVEANCSLESPWNPAPMVNWSSYSVQVSSAECPSSHEVAAVRYAWMDRPCNYKACPVYCSAGSLPAPPFTTTNSVLLGTQAPNLWDRWGEMWDKLWNIRDKQPYNKGLGHGACCVDGPQIPIWFCGKTHGPTSLMIYISFIVISWDNF